MLCLDAEHLQENYTEKNIFLVCHSHWVDFNSLESSKNTIFDQVQL